MQDRRYSIYQTYDLIWINDTRWPKREISGVDTRPAYAVVTPHSYIAGDYHDP